MADWNAVADWAAPIAVAGVVGMARWVSNVSARIDEHGERLDCPDTGLAALDKRTHDNREKVIALERDQIHGAETLDRLEAKVDRILERLSGRNGVGR